MRILHTSDWHIGRSFHGHSTLPALREVLDALTDQVRDNSVDLVIVAGDVFDSSTPPAECYTLLTDTLSGLADAGAAVVVTSGNHDSAARLGFQSGLLRSGIHVLTDPATLDAPITLTDAHGPVHVYGIPYLEPALLRRTWPGEKLRTQHDAIAHAMGLIRADRATRGGRSIVVSHCFAAGVDPTPGLERDIQQGGLDVVPLAEFEGIDYVALGHIHGRQQLAPTVRYAGAPLHYSFGEADKPRGSWLVDLSATGEASVAWLDLPIPRRLVTIRGTLDDLCSGADHEHAANAWVRAEYTDATPQRDPLRRLQARFPFCAAVVHAPEKRHDRDEQTYAGRVRTAQTHVELIDAFLAHVREGEGASEAEAALIADVLADRAVAEALA